MKKLIPILLIIFISNHLFAQDALKKYLEEKIVYPELAKQNKVYGTVKIAVKISKDGKLEKYDLVEGLGDECSAIAINTIKNINDWNTILTGWHEELSYLIPILYIHQNQFDNIIEDSIIEIKSIKQSDSIEKSIFEFVERMPEYPGGEDNLMKTISKKMKYPKKAIDNLTQGKVKVNFIVDTTGDIININIKKGIGDGCNEEAIRVVSLLEKWKPGEQNMKKVKVAYVLPLNFQFESDFNFRKYKNITSIDTVRIYNEKNLKPAYSFGNYSLKNDISENIKKEAKKINTKKSGIVKATFSVIEDGSISNIQIIKSINEEYDNAVKSALKSLPKFKFVTPNKTPTTYTIVIPFE